MQSKAETVAQYLAELPRDRRKIVEAVRHEILANLGKGFEEGMQYGMIGYYVPHRVYPAGYHCDPKQPLPFAGIASQKNYVSLYLMCLYSQSDQLQWFEAAWKKSGRKLNMGKCCIRFKSLDDVALDVVGKLIKRISAKKFIQHYEAATQRGKKSSQAVKSRPLKKSAPAKNR